jgi:hypothetical protein
MHSIKMCEGLQCTQHSHALLMLLLALLIQQALYSGTLVHGKSDRFSVVQQLCYVQQCCTYNGSIQLTSIAISYDTRVSYS